MAQFPECPTLGFGSGHDLLWNRSFLQHYCIKRCPLKMKYALNFFSITTELWLNHAKTVCNVVHTGNYEWVQRQLKLLFCCSDSLGARPHAAGPQEQRRQAPLVTAGLPPQAGPGKVCTSPGPPHLLPAVSGHRPPSPYYLCILSREFMLFFFTTAI